MRHLNWLATLTLALCSGVAVAQTPPPVVAPADSPPAAATTAAPPAAVPAPGAQAVPGQPPVAAKPEQPLFLDVSPQGAPNLPPEVRVLFGSAPNSFIATLPPAINGAPLGVPLNGILLFDHGGPPSKYMIGVQARPLSPDACEILELRCGLRIGEVIPDSPAAKAGLKVQDIIVSVGDQPLDSVEALQKVVDATDGKPVALKYVRKRDTAQVELTPVLRQEFQPPHTQNAAGVPAVTTGNHLVTAPPGSGSFALSRYYPGLITARIMSTPGAAEQVVTPLPMANPLPPGMVPLQSSSSPDAVMQALEELRREVRELRQALDQQKPTPAK